MLSGIAAINTSAAADARYKDTPKPKIPQNLITSAMAIDGQTSSNATRKTLSDAEQYTKKSVPDLDVYQFHGAPIWAKNNEKADQNQKSYLSSDCFFGGKTYVYQAMVKNMNPGVCAYYGVANPNGGQSRICSDTYQSVGMEVTSADWTTFRDTITFPAEYDSSKTGWAGQVLYQGLNVAASEDGASIAVKKNAVDEEIADALDDYSLYLAEEIAYEINITPTSAAGFDEVPTAAPGKSLGFSAEVTNQIGIKGKLSQEVGWTVVTADRTAEAAGFEKTEAGNAVTLSCGTDVSAGKYALVATSEEYGIVKGIEFEVSDGAAEKYKEFTPQTSTNLIGKPGASSFATASDTNLIDTTVTKDEGGNEKYETITAKSDIKTDYGAEGLKIKTIGSNAISEKIEAGKSYYIKARVKNPDTSKTVYFNASVSNKDGKNLSYTTEYGKTGMLLTDQWQDFEATVRVADDYDDAKAVACRFILGFANGTESGAKADIELSVQIEKEVAKSFSAEAVGGENILGGDKAPVIAADIKNQVGAAGSLSRDFEYAALKCGRSAVADGFTFTKNSDGNIAVSAGESVRAGDYDIAVYSADCGEACFVPIRVVREKYTVYVSPNGDDSAAGTYSAPLATLAGAKSFVRKKLAAGVFDYYGSLDVIFLPGEYKAVSQATFTEKDSGTAEHPIAYKAEGNVCFSGAKELDLGAAKKVTDSDVLKRLDESVRDKVVWLDISGCSVDFDKLTPRATNKQLLSNGSEYPQIYLNGNAEPQAQWPNGEGEFAKYQYVAANQFKYTEDAPSGWGDATDWWIAGYPNLDYDYARLPVTAVDPENKTITVDNGTLTGFSSSNNKSKRWKAYNLLEELDTAGEWYIDKTAKRLYYYPSESSAGGRLEISVMDGNMISMTNTEYITLEGLSFEKTRKNAISTTDIKNITIKNCRFENIDGSAFYNNGYEAAQTDKDYWQRQQINGAYDCVIENCVFSNIGFYAVYISGGNVDTLTPGRNRIENNLFYKCSDKVRGYPAIHLNGCGNILRYNNIGNLPFHAVNVSGNDHIISYNEIYDVCREAEDCAAIYQGRNSVQRGTVVSYNYIHDMLPLYTYTEDRYINAAVYWDDMQSGMTVTKNIIKGAKLGFFNNGGVDNIYTDNTIVDTYMAMRIDVRGAAQNTESPTSKGFEGYIENEELYYAKYKNLKEILETNPIYGQNTTLGKFNDTSGNLIVNSQKSSIGVSEYTKGTYEDFVNPAAQDFRVKKSSEAYQENSGLLSEDFDITEIGADMEKLSLNEDFALLAPMGRIAKADSIHFSWSAKEGATDYLLEISDKSDFSTIAYSAKVDFCYADVSAANLSASKYYWRVSAESSARNMTEKTVSAAAEFSLGEIAVKNATLSESEKDNKKNIAITADITNEAYSEIPKARLWAAAYSESGELMGIYGFDVVFENGTCGFSDAFEYTDGVSYADIFLWDGMVPLCKKLEKLYITR